MGQNAFQIPRRAWPRWVICTRETARILPGGLALWARLRQSTSVPTDDDLRVEIMDADVRAAKQDWLAARDSGAPTSIVDATFWLYTRLMSTQAQQIADAFRKARDCS